VTAYGRSKLAAEESVKGSGLRWSIVRPPIVYGPRDREILKVFRLARLRIAPVFGDGAQELSAVHAADLAAALIAVAATPSSLHATYTACHPEVFTTAEFGAAVGAAMGRTVAILRIPRLFGRALLSLTETAASVARQRTILTTDKANEFFQPAWTGDPGPLTRDTGWCATYDLERGLADTYSWYREAGWL
jgi:nucleoside-diphosphate-sugar epimerase